MTLQGKGCHPVSAGTTIASILLLCAFAAAGFWLWLKQQQILQREAFQALAARRGWSLTISEQKLGRPAILRLTARSGRGWHCESRLDPGHDPAQHQGKPGYHTTEFTAEEPRWPDGCLVLTPERAKPALAPLPAQSATMRSDASVETRINLAIPPGIAAQLRLFDAPPGMAAKASTDPVHRFDLEALTKVMVAWEPQQRKSDGEPVILISPEGFRVRLSHGMHRADQMEPFIDFALELIRVI
jgi:hypothetical protein